MYKEKNLTGEHKVNMIVGNGIFRLFFGGGRKKNIFESVHFKRSVFRLHYDTTSDHLHFFLSGIIRFVFFAASNFQNFFYKKCARVRFIFEKKRKKKNENNTFEGWCGVGRY